VAAEAFTFHRGARVLDFVGTVGSRASARPVERLPDPAALGRWLQAAGLLAEPAPAPTRADYQQALELREAIARLYTALIDARPPAAADVAVINGLAREVARGAPYLELDPSGLAERWHTQAPVRLALGRLAAEAIQLASADADRLTRCQLPGCGTLLLSRARNEPRRWCSMQTCGNRAKVAAFRARAHGGEPSAPHSAD
jgi:predicted RNA-binding Zn ribbon-like protein